MKVAVVGASGFVGRAVVKALNSRGISTVPLAAPRLPPVQPSAVAETVSEVHSVMDEYVLALDGCAAVVNAAGDPRASSRDLPAMVAANAAVPLLIGQAAVLAEVPRFVHISSAAVQGSKSVLDETLDTQPFSAYSASKALAERLLLDLPDQRVVVYRPPGVHGVDRRITRSLVAVARSPFSSVAAPTGAPTPQAHIDNVGDAVAFLAICPAQPPVIVIHPWEGLTTVGLLRLLGDREPRVVPAWAAGTVTSLLRAVGTKVGPVAANARRLEMIWHGQGQAQSWLERAGWTPPAGKDAWERTAEHVRKNRSSTTRKLAWKK